VQIGCSEWLGCCFEEEVGRILGVILGSFNDRTTCAMWSSSTMFVQSARAPHRTGNIFETAPPRNLYFYPTMKKIDYKKELKQFYKPSKKEVSMVTVPPMNYLMIDGFGSPESKAYADSIEVLFAVSYTLKFMVKKGGMDIDYGVMPLEGLWWVDDMRKWDVEKKDDWKWTSMIMQPELITHEMVNEAGEQVIKKKGLNLEKLRFEKFNEGRAGQILHVGPFTEEGPKIQMIHNHIHDQGYELSGKHHEIYLSDIRRAAPENWKTVIRQPYK